MKRTIHYIYILLAITLSISGLYAQSTSSGSRLNIPVKKKTTVADNSKFATLASGLSYKPLSLQNPKALNRFYTSFLFSSTVGPESTGVASPDVVEKSIERKSQALEAQMKVEELLYINDKISVSNIYPNPASEYAEIDFAISATLREARLTFYNVLGSQMQEYALNKSDRKLRINTKDMPTGLYFYQLSVDGKKVATKKMLVRHQQ